MQNERGDMSLRGGVLPVGKRWRTACAVSRSIERGWNVGRMDDFVSAKSGFYSVRVWVRACSECSLSKVFLPASEAVEIMEDAAVLPRYNQLCSASGVVVMFPASVQRWNK